LNNVWIYEEHTSGYGVKWKVNDILHTEQTKYQELAVVETEQWGRALILDGLLQITEKDEFIYHEMIVHPCMFTHKNPENVLIIGGGDGGSLREVLKHDQVSNVDMVEIDERVIENSKKYFPQVACAFDDPRLNLLIEDGVKYIKETDKTYDVVIVDSSDPVGPAVDLYTHDFYSNIYNHLHDDGMMTVQSESPIFYTDIFKSIYDNISAVFENCWVYLAAIATYVSGPWAFTIGSKNYNPIKLPSDITIFDDLKYYNAGIHEAAFYLPQYLKETIRN